MLPKRKKIWNLLKQLSEKHNVIDSFKENEFNELVYECFDKVTYENKNIEDLFFEYFKNKRKILDLELDILSENAKNEIDFEVLQDLIKEPEIIQEVVKEEVQPVKVVNKGGRPKKS